MKKVIILLTVVIILIAMASGAHQSKVKEVREKYEPDLFAIDGVSGVSVDEAKDEIIVYIEKPEISRKVPKKLDGFPVRYEVIGRIEALQTTTAHSPITISQATTYSRTAEQRPVFGGISVGNPFITAGTLGLVTDDNFVLSNAHVLAMDSSANFVVIGTPTWQPGKYDNATPNPIGYLKNYIPITFNKIRAKNYADAAISTLTVNGSQGSILNETDSGFYTISDTTEVVNGNTVRKSGRTTGVTSNVVTNTEASVKVYYSISKWAIFKDQILVSHVNQPFSAPGDSGSAVDKGGKFVGLLFAGSNTITVVNKAKYIISGLGISI